MAAKQPRHVRAKHPLREGWLDEALGTFVRPHFKTQGFDVPKHVRIGVGWPSRQALSLKNRRIGEAFASSASADGTHEIIISVYLEDPIEVLDTLLHEVAHATVGHEQGHRKPFVDCVTALGLIGKPTSTRPGDELLVQLQKWIKILGTYPHARLDGSQQKKETTRMLKMQCATCGMPIRTTRKWLDYHGYVWPCPCGGKLVYEEPS